jgi:ribosomal-protein-alanine N-acetyltransferase
MLLHCFTLAQESGLPSIALEVRASNHRAIGLYESFGFHQVGRRTRYYTNNNEDAIIMLTSHMDERHFREHVARLHAENTALADNYSSSYPEDLFSASAESNEE